MDALTAIETRRSLRHFDGRPVPDDLLRRLVELACLAPAPHHTRPWRFVVVRPESHERLAAAMGAAWRRDLQADGVEEARIGGLLEKSRRQIVEAPALLLACLTDEGLRRWPDERRVRAEWQMGAHSLGAALQNVLLGAHALGLAAYWISAPLFAGEAARQALDLPAGFAPQALVAAGYPAPGLAPRQRPAIDLSKMMVER